jgi:hypothetical protein
MEEWVPIVLFVVTGLVLCTFFYFRYRARQEVQHTLRIAVEHGKELTPELLEALSVDPAGGSRDLRKGVIWLALAAALGLMAWTVDEFDLLGIASFPLMLGLAYLALWRFNAGKPG